METPRWNAFGIVYGIIIATCFGMLALSIPYGVYAAFFTQLSSQYGSQTMIGYLPIYVGIVQVDIPITPTFGALFIGLTTVYVAFIAAAAVQGGGFLRSLADAARRGPAALFRNPLSATILLLGATLLATVLLQTFQTSVGVQTGGLSGDPFLLFMDLALSPLIEEIGFRFFLIGVPLFVLLLAARQPARKLLRSLWRPSAAWDAEPASDPDAIQVPTSTLRYFVYFLIVFSAILFGLAHFLSGAGWDAGKISEAALDGVTLGYLYVRYGLHAAVIFHWAVDFASNAFAFYGQGVYGISWTANSNFSLVPTYDIIILVGVPGLLLVANMFLKRVISPQREATGDDSSRQVNPGGPGGEVQGNLPDAR